MGQHTDPAQGGQGHSRCHSIDHAARGTQLRAVSALWQFLGALLTALAVYPSLFIFVVNLLLYHHSGNPATSLVPCH